MDIHISKSDYSDLLSLIDKCTSIIQDSMPSRRDYNYARRLKLIRKKIERINSKTTNNGNKK